MTNDPEQMTIAMIAPCRHCHGEVFSSTIPSSCFFFFVASSSIKELALAEEARP
jgi:hypothetical protein